MFVVCAERPSGRPFMPQSFSTLEEAMDFLDLPGVAMGTIHSKYAGGQIVFTNDPDDMES